MALEVVSKCKVELMRSRLMHNAITVLYSRSGRLATQ